MKAPPSRLVEAPFLRAQALNELTIRWLLLGSLVLSGVLASLVIGLLFFVVQLSNQVRQKDYLVISAAGAVEVSPNTIADEAVAYFAWDKAIDLLSVSNRSIVERYQALSPWLAGELQVRLGEEVRAMGDDLDQPWAEVFEAPRDQVRVERMQQDGRWVWEVTVPGTLTEYVSHLSLGDRKEVVTLLVGTQKQVGPEQPNVLEVVEFWRRTEDEQSRYERARRSAKREEP